MKKRFLIIVNLIFLILLTILCIKSQADSKIILTCDKNSINKDDEFKVTADINNTDIAAFTIWMYFDNEKVECLTKLDNINILENRIIYTWFSDTGKNKSLTELLELEFKAKDSGIATFSIIGEFYNQNGEEIDIQYNNLDVNIGEEEKIETQSDTIESQNISDDNSNLEIMRLNQEGITPNFDPNIQEYYLVIDESIDDIDVTAIPENKESQVKITGNKKLKIGKNIINIEVTSKDKTNVKNYKINITKTNNISKTNTNLETLAIENYELIPEFNNNTTNYNLEVAKDTNNLNILAIPSEMDAKVEVAGNEDLKEGNNKIIITVTAIDKITVKKYNINVYKRNESEEIEYKENEQKRIEEANNVLQKMSTESVVNPDEEISESEENENQTKQMQSTNTAQDKIFMIVGTAVSLLVLGIVIIRIKKNI